MDDLPKISVIIPTYGEDVYIEKKILNTQSQYPLEKIQIIVVCSEPSINTLKALNAFKQQDLITLIIEPSRSGKANAINLALKKSSEDICVITDNDSILEDDALLHLINALTEGIGAVSAKVIYNDKSQSNLLNALVFNRFKSGLKDLESKVDSCSYAPGELLAFRRSLVENLPQNSVCDDYYILLKVISKGYRCISEPKAVVYEAPPSTIKGKIKRTRRVTSGTLLEASIFKNMLFNKKYGFFGILIFPSYLIRIILLPLLFFSFSALLLLTLFDLSASFPFRWPLFIIGFFSILMWRQVLYVTTLLASMFLGFIDYLTGNNSPIWDDCKS